MRPRIQRAGEGVVGGEPLVPGERPDHTGLLATGTKQHVGLSLRLSGNSPWVRTVSVSLWLSG